MRAVQVEENRRVREATDREEKEENERRRDEARADRAREVEADFYRREAERAREQEEYYSKREDRFQDWWRQRFEEAFAEMEAEYEERYQEWQEEDERRQEEERENSAVGYVTTAEYDAHYHILGSLEAAAPGTLREIDFSWPPENNLLLLSEEDTVEEQSKKAYRGMRVFHPDKFQQKYTTRLHPDEKDAVMARVTEVSKGVIQQYKQYKIG